MKLKKIKFSTSTVSTHRMEKVPIKQITIESIRGKSPRTCSTSVMASESYIPKIYMENIRNRQTLVCL